MESENLTLRSNIEYADRKSRRNNIIIFGLNKPVDKPTPKFVCEELHRLLEIELTDADIDDCYRLGKTENSPIKLELISNLKKRSIFSKAKHLKGTPVRLANDLTEEQRRDFKILKENLHQARTNTSLKSYIRGNRLVIGSKEYTVEDLMKSQPEKKPQSAPSTPSTSEYSKKPRKHLQNQEVQDNSETDWETVEDNVDTSRTIAAASNSESLNIQVSSRVPRTHKVSKKKTSPRKDSKAGMKLRNGTARL